MITIDIEQLLEPISDTQQAGIDARFDEKAQKLYLKLRDLRQLARTHERETLQGLDKGNAPNWSQVLDLSFELLKSHTKDLEITCWLIEALVRQSGFAGFHSGLRLVKGFVELFWDTLYPLPDEDGLITRLACLTGLNGEENEGTLIAPLAMVPLTQGTSEGPFALWQYLQATELLKISDPDKRQQRIQNGAITFEKITIAANETAPAFFIQLKSDIENCLQELRSLSRCLDEKATDDAPPSSRLFQQLENALDAVNVIARNCLETPHQIVSTLETAAESELSRPVFHLNHIAQQREQILKSVSHAAQFFETYEPHSPLPYLLNRTIRWANMPLPQLLQEWLKDEASLKTVFELTGMGVEK